MLGSYACQALRVLRYTEVRGLPQPPSISVIALPAVAGSAFETPRCRSDERLYAGLTRRRVRQPAARRLPARSRMAFATAGDGRGLRGSVSRERHGSRTG